jgi:hypothetical protein
MRDYTDIPALAEVYLEGSFVLDIRETADRLAFTLDAVLLPAHPRFHEPRPGEQHCYLDAELVFDDARRIEWVSRTGVRYTDANDEVDLGNIDSLTHDGDVYEVTGDWGEVHVESGSFPRLQITETGMSP